MVGYLTFFSRAGKPVPNIESGRLRLLLRSRQSIKKKVTAEESFDIWAKKVWKAYMQGRESKFLPHHHPPSS